VKSTGRGGRRRSFRIAAERGANFLKAERIAPPRSAGQGRSFAQRIDLPQPPAVLCGRRAEPAAIFAAELRWAVIADGKDDFGAKVVTSWMTSEAYMAACKLKEVFWIDAADHVDPYDKRRICLACDHQARLLL
jgi:hypothetical protein